MLEPARRLIWRMAAGEQTAVDRALTPISKALWRCGYRFDFVGGFTLSAVVDGAAYRPAFAPWSLDFAQRDLRIGDGRSLVSPERRYTLVALLRQSLRSIPGAVVECGVYRGGTAYLLAEVIRNEAPERRLLLFDTFAGMPQTDRKRDVHQAGDFADTGLYDVQQYLRDFDNLAFYAGRIPETFIGLAESTYAFVHIDLDIYAAVRDATDYFYSRLAPGGIMIYDDYGMRSCPGARQAVDEFFSNKPEVPIVLSSGHCFVIKISPA